MKKASLDIFVLKLIKFIDEKTHYLTFVGKKHIN